MYGFVWKFEAIRKIMGQEVVLDPEHFALLRRSVTWVGLLEHYKEILNLQYERYVSGMGEARDEEDPPYPTMPRFTNQTVVFFTASSIFRLTEHGLCLHRFQCLGPANGRHVALAWLLGIEIPNKNSRAIVEAVARLAAIGFSDAQIKSVAIEPVKLEGIWHHINACSLGAVAYVGQGCRTELRTRFFAQAIVKAWEVRNGRSAASVPCTVSDIFRSLSHLRNSYFTGILPGDERAYEERGDE